MIFSKEVEEKIIEEYKSGKQVANIYKKYKTDYDAIKKICLENSVPLRKIGRTALPKQKEKVCSICKVLKNMECFPSHTKCPSGKDYRCKICSNLKRNDRRMKKSYGISQDYYNELFIKQEGRCDICKCEEQTIDPRNKNPRRLAVDHDHKTNKVRALLCKKCNVSLGNFNDDIELMNVAIEYLKKHKGI